MDLALPATGSPASAPNDSVAATNVMIIFFNFTSPMVNLIGLRWVAGC